MIELRLRELDPGVTQTKKKRGLSDVLGIRRSKLELSSGNYDTTVKCSLDFLLRHFASDSRPKAYQEDFVDGKLWARHRLQALALAIYGTVVFPGEPGLIDGHISTIMEQMGTGCSVVPMILGEVIRSLSYCFSHGHGCAA